MTEFMSEETRQINNKDSYENKKKNAKKALHESFSKIQKAPASGFSFADVSVPAEKKSSKVKTKKKEAARVVQTELAIPQHISPVPVEQKVVSTNQAPTINNNPGTLDLSQLATEASVDVLNNPLLQAENGKLEKTAEVKGPGPLVEKSSNIMLSANAEDEGKEDPNAVKLDKIHIQKIDKDAEKKVRHLGNSGLFSLRKKTERNYWRIFSISSIVLIVFSILSGLLATYSKYIKLSLEQVQVPPYDVFVQKIDSYEQKFSKYFKFCDYNVYQGKNLVGNNTNGNLENVVSNHKLSYIQKKNIIQTGLDDLKQKLFEQIKILNTTKQDVTKYGFMSKELYDIVQKQNQMQPIKQSLLSLEVIKFSSAMKVFSYLDTFMEGFASVVGTSVNDVESSLKSMMERGESDIYVYLNNCYLNPFERDYDCKAVGDFDLYYDKIKKDSSFDKAYFKDLIKYIDQKLEQTEIPSFSIVFRRFDPSKQQITFSIDVNTFQKDEIALLQKNISNPHIFIVTQLINLLKQSVFIVGKSINIKELNVKSKMVQIGSQQFIINNSQMSFTLPIQKTTQREIFDFAENLDTHYKGVRTLNLTKGTSQEHAVAATTGDTPIQSGGEKTILSFEEKYAKLFLDKQRKEARIQFLLQEQGEDLLLESWATELRALQQMDKYSQLEIKDVLDQIVEESFLDSVVVDLGTLRQKNAEGISLFEKLRLSVSAKNKENANLTQEITSGTQQSGAFRDTRSAFEIEK